MANEYVSYVTKLKKMSLFESSRVVRGVIEGEQEVNRYRNGL